MTKSTIARGTFAESLFNVLKKVVIEKFPDPQREDKKVVIEKFPDPQREDWLAGSPFTPFEVADLRTSWFSEGSD